MLSTKKVILIFFPALFLATVALFIRIVQYAPLHPDQTNNKENATQNQIVIPISPDDPIIGEKKAPIKIIAFEDFSCPACKQQSEILDQLITAYPAKVKVIWKGLPVNQLPYPSAEAQNYGFCAQKQGKFLEFRQMAFANSENLSANTLNLITTQINLDDTQLKKCLQSLDPGAYTTQNQNLATILNIQAVPTFFVDDKQVQNPASVDEWKILLHL